MYGEARRVKGENVNKHKSKHDCSEFYATIVEEAMLHSLIKCMHMECQRPEVQKYLLVHSGDL